jgi:hypothetical protein
MRSEPSPARQRVAAVLVEDPDLAAALPLVQRHAALQACVATTLSVRPGRGQAIAESLQELEGIGLLVLEGLVASRILISGRASAELLGPGDVLSC